MAAAVSRCRDILAIFIILEIGILWAGPVPQVSIRELVSSADLIVAGRVERVQQTVAGTVIFHGRSYPRQDFQAQISVEQIIKGEPVPPKFVFTYSTPAMDRAGNVAAGGLLAGAYRIVFLSRSPAGYAFASPYTPSLPASPASCGPNLSADPRQYAYHKVLQSILNVLCNSADHDEKLLALQTLNWGQDSAAAPFLRAVMALPDVKADPVLRTSIIGNLLKWKDLTVLPLAEDDLFLPSLHTEAYLKSNLLLAISTLEPKFSVPLLTRALKLPEPEARVGAARFLEYTHSDTAFDGLLFALDDPDREVQFAAMQSLGNLTNQYQWRPRTTEMDASWSACIQHWREFGNRRRHALSAPSSN